MRRLFGFLVLCLMLGSAAKAAEGRVYKVLPQFLDDKGHTAPSPSLYDRDAYQAYLRRNPGKISGVRFAVQWKAKDAGTNDLKLRVEIRGTGPGDLQKRKTLEMPVQQRHWFSHWDSLFLKGDEYKALGSVTAWRATLWDGDQLLSEQKSFLW